MADVEEKTQTPAGTQEEELNPDGTPLSDNQKKKRAKAAEKERAKAEKAAKLQQEKATKEANEVDFASQNYGELPLNQSQERHGRTYASLEEVKAENDGKPIYFSARIQTSRTPSSKFVFLTLRYGFHCVQAVLAQAPEQVSKQMTKWAAQLPSETIVQVEGTVSKVAKAIESSTVTAKDAEVKLSKIFVVSKVQPSVPQPFYVDDATRSDAEIEASQSTDRPMPGIPIDLRLDNRILDLRTTTNQAIFRIQHGVSKLFREYLENRDFVELHTPKLQGAATESGASVFKVSYFKGSAFLAQSPQLAKQMAIAADFGKVYEIGPVFRAEDSNTPRHMTEFTGLDLEVAIEEHYHEVLELLGNLFSFLFQELPKRYAREIAIVRKQFPSEDFLVPDQVVKLEFPQAVKMLREAGQEMGDYDDLSTEQERVLGRLVREKYQTDFFMLDKFPTAIRPFYTMPDPKNPNYSNSYDFFMRGQEIMSGAQRVHDADLLEKRMGEVNIPVEAMKEYVEGFRLGCPPHAGGGIGLERVVMFYLGLGNIRRASMFPRDPKRLAP
ncbi:aspartyl-tRNA synthetase [Microstroma glucosiphilum]|uniref:aspartate--tRNA ligase n=1 Tax=Pseudomicrostroma glucosiphilum TaxID=1684307 RepID=A0A316U5D2_9BASI|nr:aspartyl-tRNA synthetase [Pseudomicrostroma glucosiphilum]PWN20410.1 aspartyl-tRNA synthetase [Pseudomicrostroma glucosiphilum]